MSGLEVIGGISAVISILNASNALYNSARDGKRLPELFQATGRRLPILVDTLQTCKNHLEPIKDSMPAEACEALEKILDACDEKSGKLREILEKVIPGKEETWEKRYLKIIRRLGKGNRVEELMLSITQDVQLIVNNHAVKSAQPEQMMELENIVKEMKSVKSSLPEEESSAMAFNSSGGAQTNNVNSGSGQQINNNAPVSTQNFNSVTVKQKGNFSFQKPLGVCLSQAPRIESEDFVGREAELAEMKEILKPSMDSRKQGCLVLGGVGGVGKTQLAIAFAERHHTSYTSVFWLNAESEATIIDSFRSIAELAFDIQELSVLDGKQVIIHVLRWLCHTENRLWLLICDNYDDPDGLAIKDYFPPASHGTVIITTRMPDLVPGRILRIQPLKNVEESLAILQIRSGRENVRSDPHAKRLAKRLAGLPLALATAGAFLRQRTFTFERYLEEYEKRWIIDESRPTLLLEYPNRTLYTTWNLSYARLERVDPDAARLLRLLAYFHNNFLWHKLLKAGITDASPQWLHEVVVDDIKFEGVISRLSEYCFLEVNTSLKIWAMHKCVHDWTTVALNTDIDPQQYWYAFDCVALSADIKACEPFSLLCLTAHALHLEKQLIRCNDLIYDITPDQLRNATQIILLLQSVYESVAAENMCRRMLARMEKILGQDNLVTLWAITSLGEIYEHQRKYEQAEITLQRAMAEQERIIGRENYLTLFTAHHLGQTYLQRGKLKEAEAIFQRSLVIVEKELGPDHQDTLRTVHDLGTLYASQGNLKEAEAMFQRVLTSEEKTLGPDHYNTLQSLVDLGLLFWRYNKLDDAEKMYQKALAARKKTLGLDHMDTLYTMSCLGSVFDAQGKLKKAEAMQRLVLTGLTKALGPDHELTLATMNNLASVYCNQGKLKLGEAMYERILASHKGTTGLVYTNTLENLGTLKMCQGKLKEGEAMVKRASAGQEIALSSDEEICTTMRFNLGLKNQKQVKLKGANAMYQQALRCYKDTLGSDPPQA